MTHERTLPEKAWLTLGLLWIAAFLNYLARTLITTMHHSVVGAIPMTEAQFGLLTSIFLWIYGFSNPAAGFLSDRFSRSRVIFASVLVWSVVTWLTSFVRTFEQLLVMRALMGVSEACFIPAATALICDYHRGATRSLATGGVLTGALCGGGFGGVGGWLAEKHAWSYAFSVVGTIGIVYSGVLFFALRDAPDEEEAPRVPAGSPSKVRLGHALGCLMSNGAFLIELTYNAIAAVASYIIIGWMPTYIFEHFALSQGAAGFSANGYLNAADVVGVFAGGVWADRWSRHHPRGRIFVMAIGLCAGAPGVLLAATASHFAFAMLGLALYGMANGFSDCNLMPILCQIADSRYRATGYGILNMVSTVCGGLAVYATGALRDASVPYGRILAWAAVSLAICPLLVLLIKPRATQT